MSLSSLGYFALLPVTAVCYYLLAARWQKLVLAAASLVFLWINLPDGPQRLVPLILSQSRSHGGLRHDCSVLCLYLPPSGRQV